MKWIGSGWLLTFCVLGSVAIDPAHLAAQCCGTEQCAGDFDCDGQVTVNEIILAVNNALSGCPKPVGDDQACADLAAANCTKLDQCVFNGTTIRYGGASTCQARQKQACLTRLDATGTGNSSMDVELCVSQVPSASCDDFDLGNIPECQARIGTLPNSSPCTFDGQCQGSSCALFTGTTCGTCAPASYAGEPCTTISCSHGFVCNSAQQCQPRGDVGSPCDTDHPCGPMAFCVIPAGTSGTCEIAGNTIGAHCDPQHQSASGCDFNAGLYCDGSTDTCLAVTYATAGAPCGTVNHAVVKCTYASTCFGAQGTTPGICIANAADLMPCDTAVGPACVPPAICATGGPSATSGTCQLPGSIACG
jgi:hypothetical protein